jgi:hypothetical protein
MDGPGHHFLARAAFTINDDGCIGPGGVGDQLEHLLHGDADADHAIKPVFCIQFPPVVFNLRLFGHQVGDVGHGFHGTRDFSGCILEHRGIFENLNDAAVFAGECCIAAASSGPF